MSKTRRCSLCINSPNFSPNCIRKETQAKEIARRDRSEQMRKKGKPQRSIGLWWPIQKRKKRKKKKTKKAIKKPIKKVIRRKRA